MGTVGTAATGWIIFGFAVYFGTLIAIAVVGARRMRDMADYTLGGRRLSAFTAALSSGSSTASAWTMLALPALAFTGGLVQIWVPLFAAVGVFLSWTLLARRLRRYSIAANNAVTIPEFLEARFADATGLLRAVSGAVTILFVVFYVSSGLVGGSKLLEQIFGLDLVTGVALTLLAIATYTLIGGFMAVSRTDVAQALLMMGSLAVLVVTLLLETVRPFGHGAAPGFFDPFSLTDGSPITLSFVLSASGWAVGGLGAHRILQRFMALEREEGAGQARNLALVWLIAVYGLAIFVGIVARPALFEAGLLSEVMDTERVYFVVAEVFFHPVFVGALLTAVIAAVMRTADSQLLLASAIATEDLPVLKRIAQGLAANARVWMGRGLLVAIGVVSAVISVWFPDSIFNLVSYAWGGMGAAFGPVIILALYWRRFNMWGAMTSVVVGALTATLWQFTGGGPGGVWDISPATPAFLIAMAASVAVTLATPKPSSEVVALYDRVNAAPR
ncbi:MAG: sodium/proline symporter [Chloroflexota bacterium]|nr:sodium/proline symporter [Chloroflexota bacterium]